VVLRDGKPAAVILGIAQHEEWLERSEDAENLKLLRAVRAKSQSVCKAVGDVANPTASVVEATIDTASVDTRNAKRDEHLRGPDFLDAAKFPTLTFKSTKVEKAGAAWKLTGDLTLHGVTKPVVLDVTNVTPPTKDPWGNTRIGAQATTKINRQDFGIVFNKSLDGGGVLVGDEIAITIDVEVMKKGDAPAH
jgi:polyisoprenoid-binding protein YceI